MSKQLIIQTSHYKITQSLSHEDCWVFKCKGGGWFSIHASEDYIRSTYDPNYEEETTM